MIEVTAYAADKHFGEGLITSHTAAEFEAEIATVQVHSVTPGYAPFCKHMFVRNFTDALLGAAVITPENAPLIRTGYKARREGELAVLSRWFEGLVVPKAEWLDLVLYSREQMAAEGDPIEGEWGVVAILAQDTPVEAPMAPITAMRNALGIAEGGSGVPLDHDYYNRCLAYWENRARIH